MKYKYKGKIPAVVLCEGKLIKINEGTIAEFSKSPGPKFERVKEEPPQKVSTKKEKKVVSKVSPNKVISSRIETHDINNASET